MGVPGTKSYGMNSHTLAKSLRAIRVIPVHSTLTRSEYLSIREEMDTKTRMYTRHTWLK